MRGLVATIWKKKMLLGASLLVLAVAMILAGIYATLQAEARQTGRSMPVLNEKNVRIDEKVGNTLMESDTVTGVMKPDNAIVDSGLKGKAKPTNPNVKVRVNGESVAVPENGSVHKEINTQNGSTSIDVSSQSNTSSGDSSTQSSINVDVDSSVQVGSENGE